MDGLRLNKLTANFWVNYPAFNHTHDSNLGSRSPATVANKISFNTFYMQILNQIKKFQKYNYS